MKPVGGIAAAMARRHGCQRHPWRLENIGYQRSQQSANEWHGAKAACHQRIMA